MCDFLVYRPVLFIRLWLCHVGVEIGELLGFLIKRTKVAFIDFLGFTGFDKVPQNSDQDKRTDKGGVNHAPDNDADNSGAAES